jgi:hypothetical protein
VLVRFEEWEEIISLMDTFKEMKAAVSRLRLISRSDPKIRELAVSAANKSDSV